MPTAAQGPTGPSRDASPGAVPARDRGDLCPGALRLHTADDGQLARIRLPGGGLTARQAEELADAADRWGDGRLHLTSRGNVQLRGLPEGCGTELATGLARAGLLPSVRHERVRNILASPWTGLDGRGHADVLAWAAETDRLLCTSDPAQALSGRFLFAFDDGRGDVAALGADVTVVARAPRDRPPARTATIRTGGRTAVTVPAEAAPRAALAAAEVFLSLARSDGGEAWRVTDLPDGGARVADALARRLAESGTALTGTPRDLRGTVPGPEDAARPEPGLVTGPVGRTALTAAAPLGALTTRQLRLLSATAREAGAGELRVTPWREVVVPGLAHGTAEHRLADAERAGLIVSPESPWYGVSACTGRPGCGKALADVRADAATAVREGATRDRHGPAVHWSGCERRCGRPQGSHLDVLALPDGRYDLSVRDAAGRQPGRDGTPTAPDATATDVAAALRGAASTARTTAAER
ncbi:precorrin-3B synthase [Streptomyces sp. TR02-1]|uniref:precorrin-3B synthase n=1 Tax=Streptomyces sp. TR02-1 TaxID=3385977 RepID=UPI00399F8C08